MWILQSLFTQNMDIIKSFANDLINFLPQSFQSGAETPKILRAMIDICQNSDYSSYATIFHSFKEKKIQLTQTLQSEKEALVEALDQILGFLTNQNFQNLNQLLPFPKPDAFRTVFGSARFELMIEFAKVLSSLGRLENLLASSNMPHAAIFSSLQLQIFEERALFFVPNSKESPILEADLSISKRIEDSIKSIFRTGPTIFNFFKQRTAELSRDPNFGQIFDKYRVVLANFSELSKKHNKNLQQQQQIQNQAIIKTVEQKNQIDFYSSLITKEIGDFLIPFCGELLIRYFPAQSPKKQAEMPNVKKQQVIDIDDEETEKAAPKQIGKMNIKVETTTIKQEKKMTTITNVPLLPKKEEIKTLPQESIQKQQKISSKTPIFPKHNVSSSEFSSILQQASDSAIVSYKNKSSSNSEFKFESVLKQEKEFFDKASKFYSSINNSVWSFQEAHKQKQLQDKKQQILSLLRTEDFSNREIHSSFAVLSVNSETNGVCFKPPPNDDNFHNNNKG